MMNRGNGMYGSLFFVEISNKLVVEDSEISLHGSEESGGFSETFNQRFEHGELNTRLGGVLCVNINS